MFDADTKVVLVTGASSGTGHATALTLAEDGHQLLVGARRTDRLDALVETIRGVGGTVRSRQLDVTSLQSMQAFVDAALETYGRVDVMVNNAGIMPLSRLDALKIGEWNRMVDVNIRGILHGIATALPVMQRQGSGQFVTVASVGAHAPDCRGLLRH